MAPAQETASMAHEDLTREQHVEGSSDRAFAFVFAFVFAVIALWPVFSGSALRAWAAAVALAFAVVGVVRPTWLGPANRLWMRFGLLLGGIVSPIALGALFYVVMTPIGVLMRLCGNDPLRLRRDAAAQSYWLRRQPPGPTPRSMNRQF
jgi:hypothetical protein